MSITLPNLDDREFTDLMAEAKGMIPQLAPSWTDHNPSDPGITLIELFAYITEMLIYRTSRITDANKRVFLELLMGKGWLTSRTNQSIDQLVTSAIAELRREERAISNADYESFALEAKLPNQGQRPVARAYCRAKRNYQLAPANDGQFSEVMAHVSLVIIPGDAPYNTNLVKDSLAKIVFDYMEPRRLLTTQLHVVPAAYVPLGINLTLTIFNDYKEDDIRDGALLQLSQYLHPLTGGRDGKGWPLGAPVYLADIMALLDQIQGVDYVELSPGKSAIGLEKDAASLPQERLLDGKTPMVGLIYSARSKYRFPAALKYCKKTYRYRS